MRKAGLKVQESDVSSVSSFDSGEGDADANKEGGEYGTNPDTNSLANARRNARKGSQAKASAFLQKARMREAFSIIDINNDGERGSRLRAQGSGLRAQGSGSGSGETVNNGDRRFNLLPFNFISCPCP